MRGKRHQTGLSPIAIILLIALAIGGYLLYSGKISLNQKSVTTPSSQREDKVVDTPLVTDETANWKTYANSKLGLSFKYPVNYQLDEKVTKEEGIESIDSSRFVITLSSNINSLVISHPGIGRGAEDVVKTEKSIIDNIPVQKNYHSIASDKVNFVSINFENHKGNSFVIYFNAKDDKFLSKLELKTFDQILSTFKLLNE